MALSIYDLDGTLLCLWVYGRRLRILATPINWYQLSFFTLSLSNHNNPLLLHYIIITKTSKGSVKMPQIYIGWFLILNPVWCLSSLKERSKCTCQLWKVWETFQLQKKGYKNWGYSWGRINRPSVSPICTQGLPTYCKGNSF